MTHAVVPAPLEIGRANDHDIRIRWSDGHVSTYLAADLRLACPCAACAQQSKPQPRGLLRMVPAGIAAVQPLRIEVTGGFGLRVYWSDGHSQGIYAFERLRAECPCCRQESRTRGEGGH